MCAREGGREGGREDEGGMESERQREHFAGSYSVRRLFRHAPHSVYHVPTLVTQP